MNNLREFTYKINNMSNVDKSVLKSFDEDFSNVKGVLGVKFDIENSKITYAIDEWASDYDVLCKLNEICEEKGLDLSFDEESHAIDDFDNNEKNGELVEEDEDVLEQDEDLSKIQEGDEFDEKEDKVKGKLTKSDFIEKGIIFGLALVATVLSFIISGTMQSWILIIAFTLSSYETLYDVIVKIAEKQYVLDEILTFLGALIFMYLGYTEVSTIIMLIFSAVSFVKVFLTHKAVTKKEAFNEELNSLQESDDKTALQDKINYFENNKTVCDKNSIKTYSKKLKFSIAFFVVSVLVIFIPPLFSIKTYWATLSNKWLYAGATVLTLSSLGDFFYGCFKLSSNATYLAYNNNVRINDYDEFLELATINLLSFEIDGVIKNSNGNDKEDLDGAIKELKYDLSISSEILSSHNAEYVSANKKGYEFSSAKAGASVKYKKDYLKKTNSAYVSNGVSEGELLSQLNHSIAFSQGGNVTVLDEQVKRVPFIIKLSKRTGKILNFNKFFNLVYKIVLTSLTVVLALLTSFKFALLIYGIDALCKVITLLNAERNLFEVV